jgi:hypothetical protein
MGCWNKTCGLSNLHIHAGSPVYVFVLEDKRDDSHCYTTSLYRPLLLPFTSEYNDYGGGENSSGLALNLILSAIQEDLDELDVGNNQYHDIAVKKKDFNEELFFEATHEDRLSVRGTKLQFTMFRKDIVDDILDNYKVEQYVGNGTGTTGWGKNYIIYGFNDIVADIPALIMLMREGSKEDQELVKDLPADKRQRFMFRMMSFDRLHQYRDKNKAARYLASDTYRYSRLVDIKLVAGDMLAEGQTDKLIELLTEHLKAVYIDSFMHSARKTWIPGGHEGSQNTEPEAHLFLANAVIGALGREQTQWDEENLSEEELTAE